MLDGHSPQIALSMSLLSAGQGSLSVTPDWFGLKNVSVAVEDPVSRWPNQPISITLSSPLPSNSPVTSNVDWNLAFGTVSATPGNYVVVVTACDINNLCSTMNGNVVIVLPHKVKKVVDQVLAPIYSYFPPPPPPVPTQMATVIPIPASTPIPAPAKTTVSVIPRPSLQSISSGKVSAAPISASSSANSSSTNSSAANPFLPWAALAALAGMTAYTATKKAVYIPASETTASVMPAVFRSNETATNQALDGTPPPAPTPEPASPPSPPKPVSTPTPKSAAITTSNGNQSDSTPSWLSDFMQSLRSLYGAYALKDLVFTTLDSGKISVSAKNLLPGTRLQFFEKVVQKSEYDFKPGSYSPDTIFSRVGNGLLEDATDGPALVFSAGVSLLANLWNYGKDAKSPQDFIQKTFGNREFGVSTGVDTGIGVFVGLLAAAVVVLGLAGLSAIGITVTLPLWAAIAITAGIGIGIGVALDLLGVPKLLKNLINGGLEILPPVTKILQTKLMSGVQNIWNDAPGFFQQNIIQPVQKVWDDAPSFFQQNIIQPAQKVLNKANTFVQQKVIQPVQKVLNKVTTTIQQKVIQPAQKVLNKVTTTIQQKVIQPAQKVLNKVTTTIQQKVIQPAQKVLNKVTTTIQQKVIQPAQKVLNKVTTTIQQKVIQPVQKAWNSLASAVKNIGKPASTPKSTPSTPAQKISARRR